MRSPWSRWALNPIWLVSSWKMGNVAPDTHTRENTVWGQEGWCPKPRDHRKPGDGLRRVPSRGPSENMRLDGPLTPRSWTSFQSPGPWGEAFLLVKPLSLGYFVPAALGSQDTDDTGTNELSSVPGKGGVHARAGPVLTPELWSLRRTLRALFSHFILILYFLLNGYIFFYLFLIFYLFIHNYTDSL